MDTPSPKDRLLTGAQKLGKLWNEGQRCTDGWASYCTCEIPKTFCKGKELWMSLAAGEGRGLGEGPFEVVEAMLASEFEASKLTMVVEVPDLGKVRVGPKGEVPWKSFLGQDIEALRTVLSILTSFPGSKVVA